MSPSVIVMRKMLANPGNGFSKNTVEKRLPFTKWNTVSPEAYKDSELFGRHGTSCVTRKARVFQPITHFVKVAHCEAQEAIVYDQHYSPGDIE